MRQTVSPAKITRPSIARVFLRKRLFRLIDDNRTGKAIWICGPPGAGKTTLISSYIESRKLPCIWYQADEGDSDISTFFHYLGIAAKEINPRKKKSLPHLTPEYNLGINTFARRYFEELFSRVNPLPSKKLGRNAPVKGAATISRLSVAAGFSLRFVLVLDNFQEASSNKFYEVIREGLYSVPENCNIIIISRTDPPQTFARSLANQEMKTIGWKELKLNDYEAKGIARLCGQKNPAGSIMAQLQDKSEGWAAGLLLILERVKSGVYTRQDLHRVATESVFNYFMDEIFKRSDAGTQDFLLKTSLLPNMTVRMAEALSMNKDAGKILSRLSSTHFFIEKRIHDEETYQYHSLFREFLLSRARDAFTEKGLSRLKNKAANLLSKTGHIEDAARLFIETGDWHNLQCLILSNAVVLIKEGRLRMLESWIASIPEDICRKFPWLLYYLGLCRLPFHPSDARKSLESALELFKKGSDTAGIFLSWAGVIETFLHEWKFTAFDYWIKEIERLMRKIKKFPSIEVEERVTASMFAALMYHQPAHPDMARWEDKVSRIIKNSADNAQRMFIGYNLTLYYIWTGNIEKAGDLISSLSSAFKSSQSASATQLLWMVSAALYSFYTSSYKTGLKFAEEGLKIGKRTGIHLIDTTFYGQGIYNSLCMNDIKKAEGYLNQMAAILNRDSYFDTMFYAHQAALIGMHKNEFPAAIENAKESVSLSEKINSPFMLNVARIILALVLAEAGEHKMAAYHIAKVRRFSKSVRSFTFEYICLVIEALIALNRQDDKKCLNRLGKAIAISKAQGIRFFVAHRQSSIVSLCTKAIEAGLETEYVKDLIRVNNLTPPSHPFEKGGLGIEDWPWQLKIFTLGRFKLFKEDKEIEFSGKTQKKPLAMLKAIISLGGIDVSEGDISDALWPDADGDRAKQSFYTTLHRLRSLIGNPNIIRQREERLTLDSRYCYVDVWGFENIIRQSNKISDKQKSISLIEKALDLYKGHFLEGDADDSQTGHYREALRDKFIKCLTMLGEYYEEKGWDDKAIDLYRRGIEIDGLVEDFYQRLMVCYKRMRNRNEALRVYKECVLTMSGKLGIEPSYEIRAIHKSLLTQ